ADLALVRTAAAREEVIVLGPRFEQLAVRVDDEDAVAELGSRKRRLLFERSPSAGERRRQRVRELQLAPVEHKDAVWRFRENAALRALDVSRARERLRPFLDNVVRPRFLLAAFLKEGGRRQQPEPEYRRKGERWCTHGPLSQCDRCYFTYRHLCV